jgi:hypothetical protein
MTINCVECRRPIKVREGERIVRESIEETNAQTLYAFGAVGVHVGIRRALYEGGFRTIGDVKRATDAELLAVKGIGPSRVSVLRWALPMLDKLRLSWAGAYEADERASD